MSLYCVRNVPAPRRQLRVGSEWENVLWILRERDRWLKGEAKFLSSLRIFISQGYNGEQREGSCQKF